jgi:hypothetical protein
MDREEGPFVWSTVDLGNFCRALWVDELVKVSQSAEFVSCQTR